MYRLTRRDETRRDETEQRREGERKRSARGGRAKRGRKNGRLRHDLADGRNETELPARIPPPVWKQLLCQPAPENYSVAWRTGKPRQVYLLRVAIRMWQGYAARKITFHPIRTTLFHAVLHLPSVRSRMKEKNCPRCGMLSNRSIAALRFFLYLERRFSFFFSRRMIHHRWFQFI